MKKKTASARRQSKSFNKNFCNRLRGNAEPVFINNDYVHNFLRISLKLLYNNLEIIYQ